MSYYLEKVVSGKGEPVELEIILTSIGSKDDPMYDCYLSAITFPGMKKDDREYLELKSKSKKTAGDVTWVIKNVEGDKADPDDPEEEKRIITYKMPEVIFKSFEDEGTGNMVKATISFPFEAVLTTDNWVE